MSDKLVKDVRAVIDDIFKEKEEEAMRKETEHALLASATKIQELDESLEAKDEEVADLKSKIAELEDTIAELSDNVNKLETDKESLEAEKAEFDNQKEEVVKRAEEAEKALEDIKKDQLAQSRFDDLKEAGVAATGDGVEVQVAKIREMEDEEFEAYKDERVALRASIIEELDSTDENASEEEESEEASESEEESVSEEENSEAEEESASEEENSEESEEEAASSEDNISNVMKAIASMVDMESEPTQDVVSKYAKLGEALAEKYKGKGE